MKPRTKTGAGIQFPFVFQKNGRTGRIKKWGSEKFGTYFVFAGQKMRNSFGSFERALTYLEHEFSKIDSDAANSLALHPLNSDVRTYSELEQLLRLEGGGATLREAVTFFLANHRGKRFQPASFDDCSTAFLKAQRAKNVSAGQIETLAKHYRRFSSSFGQRPVHEITALEVETWLGSRADERDGSPWSAKTRNSVRGSLVSLSLYAQNVLRAIPDNGKTEFQRILISKADHRQEVEIYLTPRMCAKWVDDTPDNFVFDVKCFRLLSRHATKADALPSDLQDAADLTDRGNVVLTPAFEEEIAGQFLAGLEPLERSGKLGALLLQMTPGFAPRSADLTALEPLFRQLKGSGKHARRVVLELRHHDWLNERHREETTSFLREQGVTLASIDGPPADKKHFTIMPAVDVITDPRLAYLRLHGRDPKAYLTGKTVAERFHYDYSDDELGEVTERAHHLATAADEVHVVFNNNSRDFAPKAAERLRRRLGQSSR